MPIKICFQPACYKNVCLGKFQDEWGKGGDAKWKGVNHKISKIIIK